MDDTKQVNLSEALLKNIMTWLQAEPSTLYDLCLAMVTNPLLAAVSPAPAISHTTGQFPSDSSWVPETSVLTEKQK